MSVPDYEQQPPLLKTKLYRPQPRSSLVARPRLMSIISAGLTRKLTLISAPPGFGKTTLAAAWAATGAANEPNVAWLSLEPADNHGVRFWNYVLAALEQAAPGVARDALRLLNARPQAPLSTMVDALVNSCADLPEQIVLVLDDYHEIEVKPIQESVSYLVDHQPPNLHVIMTSRSDPALPLTRLRAHADLVEIRAKDLRFTAEESAAFLEAVMGVRLTERQLALLDERTEGWVTGLQLAALSMQGTADVDGFVTAFAGSHQYIVDYLLEEVLAQQPEPIQRFLLQTAVLDRLSGPLCDAVTGQTGGQAMLEELEKRNLFVISLDQKRRWYRYHHLFAEVLRARLEQSRPDILRQLHERACDWLAVHELHEQAIGHALAGGAFERAGALVAQVANLVYERGDSGTVRGWLEAMPQALVRSQPELCILLGRACVVEGRLDQSLSYADTAEQLLGEGTSQTDRDLLGKAAAIRANVARIRRDMKLAVEMTERSLALLAPSSGMWRGAVLASLGVMHHITGRQSEALAVLARAEEEHLAAGDLHGYIRAACWRADLLVSLARTRDAMACYDRAIALAVHQDKESVPVVGLAYVGAGRLLAEWNALTKAEQYLRMGIDLCDQGSLVDMHWSGALALAQVKQALGDEAGAVALLYKADDLAVATNLPLAGARNAPNWARYHLAVGDINSAKGLEPLLEQLTGDRSNAGQQAQTALALLMLYDGRPVEAIERAEVALAARQPLQLPGILIEPLTILAMALYKQGEQQAALDAFERSLDLAEAEGYVRVYLNLGRAIIPLLEATRPQLQPRLAAYAERLLRAFGVQASVKPPAVQPVGAPSVEALSEREREVLALIAAGASNETIAQQLFITLNTAKKHVANILGKLGVANRTQAAAKAKDYGL